jgi:thiamine pyrophosphokinase
VSASVDRPGADSGEASSAIVLAGGDPVTGALPRPLPTGATVIAADQGFATAAVLGLRVDLLVGDLDSVTADDLDRARAEGVSIDRHPVSKDRTDLAIALDAAAEQGAGEVTVVGGHGGRLDHLLAGLLLLAEPAYADMRISALMGPAVVTVIRGGATLHGPVGDLLSLIPVHGPARGIDTTGLEYPLRDGELLPGSSRGVSNVLRDPAASVTVREGVLMAVQPGVPDDTQAGDTTR